MLARYLSVIINTMPAVSDRIERNDRKCQRTERKTSAFPPAFRPACHGSSVGRPGRAPAVPTDNGLVVVVVVSARRYVRTNALPPVVRLLVGRTRARTTRPVNTRVTAGYRYVVAVNTPVVSRVPDALSENIVRSEAKPNARLGFEGPT